MCHSPDKECLNAIISIVTALATFLVAILAIWGEWFRNRFAAPKLILKPYNLRGNVTPRNNGIETIYYHLKVINLRKWSIARKVSVRCVGVKKRNVSGDFSPQPLYVPIHFIYSPAELGFIEHDIGSPQVLDFGHLNKGEDSFKPAFLLTPNNFPGFVGKNEAVRLDLQIYADNFSSDKVFTYEISWDGIWDDDLDKMRDHLVIKEIF